MINFLKVQLFSKHLKDIKLYSTELLRGRDDVRPQTEVENTSRQSSILLRVFQQQRTDQSESFLLVSPNLYFSTRTKTRQLNLLFCMLWLAALAVSTMFIYS